MRTLIAVGALAVYAASPGLRAAVPEYGYEVVHVYPHDRASFTEGLFYLNGFLLSLIHIYPLDTHSAGCAAGWADSGGIRRGL